MRMINFKDSKIKNGNIIEVLLNEILFIGVCFFLNTECSIFADLIQIILLFFLLVSIVCLFYCIIFIYLDSPLRAGGVPVDYVTQFP